MHFYKKINQLFLALLLGVFTTILPLEVLAGNKLLIKSAELVTQDDDYELNAQLEVKFGEKIEEALLKGFELHLVLEFQLASPIKYWFDDEIVTITYPMTLGYHPLSRQFLLTQSGVQKSFASLSELAVELTQLKHIRIIKKSEIEKSERYKALLLIRLDNKKLPKAVQEIDDDPEAWEMKSQLFEWAPAILK